MGKSGNLPQVTYLEMEEPYSNQALISKLSFLTSNLCIFYSIADVSMFIKVDLKLIIAQNLEGLGV